MLPVQHPQSLRGLVDAGVLHHLNVLALGDARKVIKEFIEKVAGLLVHVRAVAAHGQG